VFCSFMDVFFVFLAEIRWGVVTDGTYIQEGLYDCRRYKKSERSYDGFGLE
jgi:hypothetical protein